MGSNTSWFTSDWHLGHEGTRKHRLDFKNNTVQEMDEKILSNLFEVVKRGDNLYFLGDIGLLSKDALNDLFNRIHKAGINFHWVNGNHDPYPSYTHKAIKWRGDLKDIKVEGQKITLCHYPMIVWNCSHYGAWQLYGHIHYGDHGDTVLKERKASDQTTLGKQMNMNVEFSNYYPLSFEQIKRRMDIFYRDNFDLIIKK